MRSVTDGLAIGRCDNERCRQLLHPADIEAGWCPFCQRHQRPVSRFHGKGRGRKETRVDVVFPDSINDAAKEARE